MHVPVCIKWTAGLTVMTEFHDQGFCVKALTAGGMRIQMFEVKGPGQNQFPQRQLSLPIYGCLCTYPTSDPRRFLLLS